MQMETIKTIHPSTCRFTILDSSHYRDDSTCKCNDAEHRKRMIKEWGYKPRDFKGIPLKTNKTVQKYLNIIKSGKFEESEIISLKSMLQGSKGTWTQEEIKLVEEKLLAKGKFKLSPKQQLKGINWLRRKSFKLNGDVRKNCPFDANELDMLSPKNYKGFTFIGYSDVSQNMRRSLSPIYVLHTKDGRQLVYCVDYRDRKGISIY